MKNLKIAIFSFLMIFTMLNISCKREIENVDEMQQVQENDLVRSVVSSLLIVGERNAQNNNGDVVSQTQNAIESYFCFDIVYPVSILYNDGSTQSLADDNEMAQAISGQTANHFIIDFVYPFDVIDNGNTVTINDGSDFENLVNSCITITPVTPVQDFCFDFVFPVTIEMTDGSTVTVNNQQEFDNLFINANANQVYPADLVYPFDVNQNGTIITITNSVEYQALLDSCFGGGFYESALPPSVAFNNCFTLTYPVDLVYADGTTVTVNDDTEYDAALMNAVSNPVEDFVYDIEIVQNGTPIMVHDINEFYDILMVCASMPSGYHYSNIPPTSHFSGCFTINYPIVIVMNDGSTVTVNNDNEYDDALANSTTNAYAEDFQYPFSVNQNGQDYAINNINDFFAMVMNCTNNNPM